MHKSMYNGSKVAVYKSVLWLKSMYLYINNNDASKKQTFRHIINFKIKNKSEVFTKHL